MQSSPVNDAALSLIKEFEGLRLAAYQDSVGVWTIGYGTTAAAGVGVSPFKGMTITEKQAEEYLLYVLNGIVNDIKKYVTVPLTDNQIGALASFVYNVGIGNFKNSTLLKKLNTKDYSGAADQFLRWNKAGGKVLPGLTRRRSAERALFLTK